MELAFEGVPKETVSREDGWLDKAVTELLYT